MSSLWNKIKSWFSRSDDNFLRIVEELEFRITENDDFLLRVAEEIASQGAIAADDVAQHIDHYDVAQEMDASAIAEYVAEDIDLSDIAEQLEIDAQAIADEFDTNEIASCIDIDYDEVRAGLDLDAFQDAFRSMMRRNLPSPVEVDTIVNAVIDEVISRLEAN